MVQDTEKRIESLMDKLASDQVSKPILAQLIHLSNALKVRNIQSATQITLQLMTDSFDQEGKWVVGLKRLVELYARIQ